MKLKNVTFVRAKAFEELRQKVKWADWDISSVIILEKAIEELLAKDPDERYFRKNK